MVRPFVGAITLGLWVLTGLVLYWGLASQSWTPVQGTVSSTVLTWTTSGVGDNQQKTGYTIDVLHEYIYDGQKFTSKMINPPFNDPVSGHYYKYPQTGGMDLLKQFTQGARVTVYVDKSKPSLSCLIPGLNVLKVVVLAGACVFLTLVTVFTRD